MGGGGGVDSGSTAISNYNGKKTPQRNSSDEKFKNNQINSSLEAQSISKTNNYRKITSNNDASGDALTSSGGSKIARNAIINMKAKSGESRKKKTSADTPIDQNQPLEAYSSSSSSSSSSSASASSTVEQIRATVLRARDLADVYLATESAASPDTISAAGTGTTGTAGTALPPPGVYPSVPSSSSRAENVENTAGTGTGAGAERGTRGNNHKRADVTHLGNSEEKYTQPIIEELHVSAGECVFCIA